MSVETAKAYLLRRAAELGVELEIVASEERELTLEAHGERLSDMTQASRGGLGLRVVAGGKTGYASTEELSEDALEWTLREAHENALLQTSSDGFLPEGGALGTKDLISEGLSAPTEAKAEAALALERGLRADPRFHQTMLARYSEHESRVSLASSKGVSGGYRNGYSAVMASFILRDGESVKQGWDAHVEKEFHALDPGKTAQKMLQETGRLLGARPLKTGRYTAYFEPKAFAQLLAVFAYMVNGKTLVDGKSRLAGKLGERVASDLVTLQDDPTLPRGLASRPFDSEGTPARPVTLIEKGVFRSFLHNSATAKESGQENTGHAARSYRGTLGVGTSNFFLEPGAGVSLGRGVSVTGLSGVHAGANPISGDFSVQAFGLYLEDGEAAYPVENFVVSGNLLELLKNVTAVGDDFIWLPYGGIIGTPTVEVAELSFGGA
jgi:PmbA protein